MASWGNDITVYMVVALRTSWLIWESAAGFEAGSGGFWYEACAKLLACGRLHYGTPFLSGVGGPNSKGPLCRLCASGYDASDLKVRAATFGGKLPQDI